MATYIADRYRLKKKDIGGGNMASIHLCEDTDVDDDEVDSSVIIKMFNKLNIGDEDLQKQVFNREVESLDKLNHKNVVKILDRGYDEGFKAFFIVLEYVQGKTFKEAFEDICRYDYAQKLELMEQVVDGIEYLHKKNIIHRDLKPSNIMFDKDGTVKIIDFGISKLKDTFYSDYTLAGFVTKNYSSPEQMARKTITNQSDIYSLGLIFYEIFICSCITTRESMDVGSLPAGMQRILINITQEEPKLRYATISELKRDLEKEHSILVQEKFMSLGFTNTVTKRLLNDGYIEKEENTLAMNVLEEEYSGKCYMWPAKNRETGEFEGSFELYGRRFLSILKFDQRDSSRFTIISMVFIPADRLMMRKECGYEIPYGIKVSGGSARIKTKSEIDAQTVCEEVLNHEAEFNSQRSDDMHLKDITRKWRDILELEKKRLSQEKFTLKYNNCKINEQDASLEIDIDTNRTYELNYTSDDMLQMTTKKNIHHYIDVGRMRECSDGHMVIDLTPQVDYSNIASSGEISISMRMAEIALQRQSKALKSVQYKENVNPEISEIIFNPEKASSKNNLILTEEDCKSTEIDRSKLLSLEKALSSDNMFLLQGPPGTGKTTFIAELVYQILHSNDKFRGNPDAKILIASQSHVAVDHSLSKIKKLIPDIKMIRVGIIDKMAEASRDYTLDIFCKEWTQKVIENCKIALTKYKEEIGIDDSLQEKNGMISEIESITQEISNLMEELKDVETELEKVNVLDAKWKFVNDKISSMKKKVSIKTSGITEEHLSRIIDEFTDSLSGLNDKLASIIDESIELSEQKITLEERYAAINENMGVKGREVNEWKELLGVTSQEEYLQVKDDIQNSLKENKKKYATYSKVESLCKEWQKRVTLGDGLMQESLADATLVGATCLGIASLSDAIEFNYDWVIVDEAGKATPPEILVPICLGKKVVLVGDHKQLPPVVDEALLKLQDKERMSIRKEDLEQSLFEYLENRLNGDCKSILDEQYRMNPVIGDLISELFYDGQLVSKTSREEKTIPLKMYEEKPLVWLTTSENADRREERISDSYGNSCEAKIIFEQLLLIDEELGEQKFKKETAIIAGYRGQRDKLNRLYESNYKVKFHNMTVEINTVDAFQGRETDIVFYSVVRSNEEGKLGFLKDVRRLNVAFSRAKELLVVVGDHHCAQKQIEVAGQENPFVRIIRYLRNNPDDCLMKEV
nr:AAA domain-containing protein [uncultured Acetobacterium sp.]